jgi:hypothetical protein
VARSCEHGNEPLGSIRGGKFFLFTRLIPVSQMCIYRCIYALSMNKSKDVIPGHSQSPAGSFALTSTLPYVKLKDSTVRIRAELMGFRRLVSLPVRSQPQSCGFVHLDKRGQILNTHAHAK